MNDEEKIAFLEGKIKVLQKFYAAALADSTVRYGNAGILAEIESQKHAEQMNSGRAYAAQFGVKEPKQVFEKVQDVFGCATWVCEDTEKGFTAVSNACMLCSFTKKMGAYSPCKMHCLSPIEAMIKAVNPDAGFTVEKTLWDNDKCEVKIRV
ncbi:MAG: hypothetical protein FWH41_03410 [Treponema sp.]|nr:hypothetical protein [Treponema sp.]